MWLCIMKDTQRLQVVSCIAQTAPRKKNDCGDRTDKSHREQTSAQGTNCVIDIGVYYRYVLQVLMR